MSVVKPGDISDWWRLRDEGAVSPESLDGMFESIKTYLEAEIPQVIKLREQERKRLEDHTRRYLEAKRRAGEEEIEDDVAIYEGIRPPGLVTPKITKKLPDKNFFLEKLRNIALEYLGNGNIGKEQEVQAFVVKIFSDPMYQ